MPDLVDVEPDPQPESVARHADGQPNSTADFVVPEMGVAIYIGGAAFRWGTGCAGTGSSGSDCDRAAQGVGW